MLYQFTTSHLSKGNAIFPTKLLIDLTKDRIIIKKHHLVGSEQTMLRISNVISVTTRHFNEKFIFSEIVLNTASNEVRLNGFSPQDAKKIKSIFERLV
ncbi:MAG: hypothetical protein K9I69_03265 [Ignavibacteriales bacterium]|nr:hypothetical protein [Ignavibacteriales bacterium]MCF8306322.1 hypothetical protein [Ignavibacteriales bacterium]MCF8316043.1 hypothetical protein [Ignavibacteriales bacterium]MCF8437637.1 hypothetical protein [Ignavibacteriales bacterium]